MSRFYRCPDCERLLITDPHGSPVSHDCSTTQPFTP